MIPKLYSKGTEEQSGVQSRPQDSPVLLETIVDKVDFEKARKILTQDLTMKYQGEGLNAWNRHYARYPSYKLVREGYGDKMLDKMVAVYRDCIRELETGWKPQH